MSELSEQLLALGEDDFYHHPATVRALIEKAAAALARAEETEAAWERARDQVAAGTITCFDCRMLINAARAYSRKECPPTPTPEPKDD